MNNYISIKSVLSEVLDHPLLKDVTLERAVMYAIEFLRKLGCPPIFLEKVETLKVEDHRAKLPCDFYEMNQIRLDCQGTMKVFKASTDTFHMEKINRDELTYKLQGGMIITSIREGSIIISYQALAMDEEGYPLIPDNSSLIDALGLYIKKKKFSILFDLNSISPQVYQQVQRDYAWAVGQAQSSLIMPSIDEMESITRSWNTLIPRMDEHSRGFRTNNITEHLMTH